MANEKKGTKSNRKRGPALRVHCFGTLELSLAGAPLEGFESQKVRALFVYLACHHDQPLTRDHLAAFFWPDKDEESARRNLRQSLYNLKGIFPEGVSVLQANRQSVQLDPSLDCWVDAVAFEQALESGGTEQRLDPHRITEAVGLYRGDFLSGFQVKDAEEFDFWLGAQQERLREQAVSALRLLIESYLDRGEYRLGIQYAQRLVAIDPLSEDAHQQLMQLYALSGRRSRALAQYDDLARMLKRELDVEPLEETQSLYHRILEQGASLPDVDGTSEAIGPHIPMAGRSEEYQQLRSCMEAALGGEGLLTVIEGEAGVGKTRLVRSFLDAASSEGQTLILKGSCLDVLPESFQPLSRALSGALYPGSELAQEVLDGLEPDTLLQLERLVPAIAVETTSAKRGRTPSPDTARKRSFETVATVLTALCGLPGHRLRRVIVLLDDLQRADPATLDLLRFLSDRLAAFPIWIVSACTRDRLPPDHPVHRFVDDSVADDHRIPLSRLEVDAIAELASALVPQGQAGELRDFLARNTAGLPHLLTECINYLRDRGFLLPDAGRWTLAQSLEDLEVQVSDLEEVIARRYEGLPHSTRRLGALAAVSGSRFEPQQIAAAGQEHPAVSQIAFDVMLQRWMIRPASDRWQHRQAQAPADDADRAGETALFEFASETIWRTVYEGITPARRRLMHGDIARTLEAFHGDDTLAHCETLAHHFRAAGIHGSARRYLERAAEKAAACGASETACLYYQLAEEETAAEIASTDDADRDLRSELDRIGDLKRDFERVVGR